MKLVTIPLVLPEELYLNWTRRAGDDHVSLNEAIVKILMRQHTDSRTSGLQQDRTRDAVPARPGPTFGLPWCRRWDDRIAQEYEKRHGSNDTKDMPRKPLPE